MQAHTHTNTYVDTETGQHELSFPPHISQLGKYTHSLPLSSQDFFFFIEEKKNGNTPTSSSFLNNG